MNFPETLAIVGSGPSAIYLLKHIFDHRSELASRLQEIMVFEKGAQTGLGMPYSPETTDRYNMSNISSEELPELPTTFAEWLGEQTPAVLESLGLEKAPISDEEIYSRLALGQYFKAQYQLLISWLEEAGIHVTEHAGCPITDIKDDDDRERVVLFLSINQIFEADRVVIATGHYWPPEDKPAAGYFASPWPISKLLPKDGAHHPFTIGTLGASLSAYDVISSLAHRHGDFRQEGGRMTYHPHEGTEDFKIVMHSAQGLLPHLQFDQDNPRREIYRHVSRAELLHLLDKDGFLRLETYFDKVCRPALRKAFQKDGMSDMAGRLEDPDFDLNDFVEAMADKHDYDNAFEGMRMEMAEARESVEKHRPIHWKEVVDDLIYTLNYHASLMPAEDHLQLHDKVMPFVMNVIAAMPLPSGNSILALYDAKKLEMVAGKVTQVSKHGARGHTRVEVEDEKGTSTFNYRMFVDCSGQSPVGARDYPFASLRKKRRVREAAAPFANPPSATETPEDQKEHIIDKNGCWFYRTGGIDIDERYRVVGEDGIANPRIHDIAFPHTRGHRPYSYGLQACSHTAGMVVQSWLEEMAREAKNPT